VTKAIKRYLQSILNINMNINYVIKFNKYNSQNLK